MSTTCAIELQNNGGNIVYAGQELCGTVRLTLTEETHLHGVYIQINGKGICQWVEGRTTFNGRTDYLNEIIYFIGGEYDDVRIDPNTYTNNFRCLLPPQLPGSMEEKFGHIRYSVRVVLASFSILPDKKFKQQFRVVRQLNLNDFPALRQSIVTNATYKFRFSDFLCICPLLMRQPKIVAKIPMSGYAPLQIIKVEIHVEDQNGDANCEFSVKLIKRIYYNAQTPTQRKRKEKQTIVKKMVNVHIQNTYEMINVDLQVPPLLPTDFSTNSIINVTYYVFIKAKTGFCDRIPVVKLPVTIGTYPIQNVELSPGEIVSSATPRHLEFGNSNNSELPSYAETTIN